ncbi:MAG: TIGR00159 family protein [Erysipelotrichaceae bacterium]|nr:TIGR00159 family protein [Erysipelotrichaceae bacterium]
MFIDIFIMWFVLYYAIKVIRNNSRTSQIFKGILLVILIDVFAKLLGLTTVAWLADMFVNWGFLAVIIVFQPEIRSMLERIGKSNVFSRITTLSGNEKEQLVDQIVNATMLLARDQTGALISIEQSHSLSDYIKTGTQINSIVTAELLTSIFVTSTPLHDGAVIIQGDRIACASAYFPSTNLDLPSKYGARHRAAIGISEISDAITIVVSEESGGVSITEAGKIFSVNRRQLRDYLMRVICGEETEMKSSRPKIAIVDDLPKMKKKEQKVDKEDEYTISDDMEAIDITKPIPRPESEKRVDTSVLSKLAIKKQASLKEEEEPEEEEIIEESEQKKKKRFNLFSKKEKVIQEEQQEEQQEETKEAEEIVDIVETIDDKPIIHQVDEEKIAQFEDQPFVDEIEDIGIKLPKKKKEHIPYVRNENVRVMGFEEVPETVKEEKMSQESETPENKEKAITNSSNQINDSTEFDTTSIDISKIMGFDNELSDTFAILDGIDEVKKKKTVAAFTDVEKITPPNKNEGGVDNE